MPNKIKIISKEDIDACVRLYVVDKLGTLPISKIFNVSRQTVSSLLVREGVQLRPKNKKVIINDIAIIDMYKQGNTVSYISNLKGLSCWSIFRYLRENNIDIRNNDNIDRRNQSAINMALRIQRLGSVKIGDNEYKLINLLKSKYNCVLPQHRIEINGHYFDAFAGNILWEFDEIRHKTAKYKKKDIRYDLRAKELGYEVRRISELDIDEHGLERWYNHQND